MGKIIKFSEAKKMSNESHNLKGKMESDIDLFYLSLFSHLENDRCFIGIIEQWPCFYDESFEGGLRKLFEKYCDNKLSNSQENVIDLMLHIHDPRFTFDVTLSLKNWSEEDRSFFLYFIEKHAEAIHEVKE